MDPLSELTVADLRRRRSAKWAAHGPEVLPLWVAEMDVPLAPAIAEALHTAIDHHDLGYSVGVHDYLGAYAGFARGRWGWTPPPAERVALVPDVMLGVVEALQLVTAPGDPVLFDDPVYPPFRGFVEHADRQPVAVPLRNDGRLDLDALDAAFGAATAGDGRAAYLLCSPHNPTGAVHTADELAGLAELATRHGVRVVADEIHAPVVRPGATFVPYLSVPGTEDAFALVSASKGWSLAGVKAALLQAGPQAADELAQLPEIVGHGASHLGVLAHTAAFADGSLWLDAVLAGLDRNVEVLTELLAAHLPEVRWRPGAATYLAWLDVRELGLGARPAAALLEHDVALSEGADFGPAGAGHVRLNLATSPAMLADAVARIAAAAR